MKNVLDALGLGPYRRVINNDDGTYTLIITPLEHFVPNHTNASKIILTDDQLKRYNLWGIKITLLREALPDLTPEQREIILTGYKPEGK